MKQASLDNKPRIKHFSFDANRIAGGGENDFLRMCDEFEGQIKSYLVRPRCLSTGKLDS